MVLQLAELQELLPTMSAGQTAMHMPSAAAMQTHPERHAHLTSAAVSTDSVG